MPQERQNYSKDFYRAGFLINHLFCIFFEITLLTSQCMRKKQSANADKNGSLLELGLKSM
jgi:hypothetical protein